MSIVPKGASSRIFSNDDGINPNCLTYGQQKGSLYELSRTEIILEISRPQP
jgi:hypothetical protein